MFYRSPELCGIRKYSYRTLLREIISQWPNALYDRCSIGMDIRSGSVNVYPLRRYVTLDFLTKVTKNLYDGSSTNTVSPGLNNLSIRFHTPALDPLFMITSSLSRNLDYFFTKRHPQGHRYRSGQAVRFQSRHKHGGLNFVVIPVPTLS